MNLGASIFEAGHLQKAEFMFLYQTYYPPRLYLWLFEGLYETFPVLLFCMQVSLTKVKSWVHSIVPEGSTKNNEASRT